MRTPVEPSMTYPSRMISGMPSLFTSWMDGLDQTSRLVEAPGAWSYVPSSRHTNGVTPSARVAFTLGHRGFHVFVPVRVNATVVRSPMYATISGTPSPLRSATATADGEFTQST